MNKTDLSKYNNNWYKKSNYTKGLFITMLWFLANRFFLNSYLLIPVQIKVIVLRLFGAKISKNVMIKHKVNIKYPWNLEIEENVWIGENVWIDNLGKVKIKKNACISQGAMLLSGNHDFTKTTFDLIIKDILIEEGVWIGAKAIVCGGVTCFSHAVLTVNSVATKNLESYNIYQGNPAQAIKVRSFTT